MKGKNSFLLLILLIAMSGVGCITSNPDTGGGGSLQQLTEAPAFVLSDLQGREVKFPGDFSGEKAALVFFSTT